MEVMFKKLHEDAKMPEYATEGAAAFDLFAYKIEKATRKIFDDDGSFMCRDDYAMCQTGLACAIPKGFVMLIFSRSGHGFKYGVRLANCVGVIDSDYRGEIMVKLRSDIDHPIHLHKGDRVAQAMIVPCPKVTLLEVEELDETERGDGGFGSTGDGEVQGRKFFGMPK